jgi:hypothetical protein
MKANALHILAGPLLALALIAGCSDSPSSSGTGRLKVYLTDSPADFDEVNIKVDRVEVHSTGSDSLSGWAVVNADTATYDLLILRNGANALLGDQMLPAGKYTQIRLFIGDSSNVLVDGVRYDLEIPSNVVKLNHNFDIIEGVLYELTLDFDAARSIVLTGNGRYKLQPVIRVTANAVSGAISGTVLPASAASFVMTTVGTDTVSAFCDTLMGEFLLAVMPVGIYDLSIIPSDITYRDTIVADVHVNALQETDIGTILLSPR